MQYLPNEGKFFFLLRNYTYLLVTCFTLDNEKKIVSTQTAALDDGDYESLLKNHKGISTYYITYFLIIHSCPLHKNFSPLHQKTLKKILAPNPFSPFLLGNVICGCFPRL